jgi:hypothetical protein
MIRIGSSYQLTELGARIVLLRLRRRYETGLNFPKFSKGILKQQPTANWHTEPTNLSTPRDPEWVDVAPRPGWTRALPAAAHRFTSPMMCRWLGDRLVRHLWHFGRNGRKGSARNFLPASGQVDEPSIDPWIAAVHLRLSDLF